MTVSVNRVHEWSIASTKQYVNPFRTLQVDAHVTDANGNEWQIPAFWRDNGIWSFRFSSSTPGVFTWRTVCSDTTNPELHGATGDFTVEMATEANPLYRHGRVQTAEEGGYFVHTDGTPFFWLSDNWSMGLSKRLPFACLQELIRNRKEKNFSVAMLSMGQFPDMMPFDDRAESEAGFPWDEKFTTICPAYYDAADRRIEAIIDGGLVPFLAGSWGHFIQFADEAFIRLHWRNLIARYAAYPVVFCVAGEGTMMIHGDFRYTPEQNRPYREILLDPEKRVLHGEQARRIWTETAEYIHRTDPFGTILSISPTADGYPYPHTARAQVTDESVIDFEMIHDYNPRNLTGRVQKAQQETRRIPIVCANPMDGTGGSPEGQRTLFWTSILNGACGINYGSSGVYFANCCGSLFGPSGHGCTWSFETLEDSMDAPGSKAIGQCKQLLQQYPWQTLAPHPEWFIGPKADAFANPDVMTSGAVDLPPILAAGMDNGVRLFFIPAYITREAFFGRKPRLQIGTKPVRATVIVLSTMTKYEFGTACPDNSGEWIMHKRHCFYQPVFGDILLILDPTQPLDPNEPIYQPFDAMELPQEDDDLLLALCRPSKE